MDKKVYNRGMLGQWFYNSTEILALALTYRRMPKDIDYRKKVPYANEKNTHMNILTRKDLKDVKKPLFIYIHGGGWISGLLDMRNQYVVNWAQKGFFSASLNYSFAPQKVFPTQIQEIFTAIDYIYDSADKENIDTENIIISGESAGGYFITYVASCANNPELLDKLGIEFKNRDKFRIKAIVSHGGCYDFNRLTDSSKPQSKFPDIKMMSSTFVGMTFKNLREHLKTQEGKLLSPEFKEGFPPMFLVWGAMDYLRYETFDLAEQLKKIGTEHRVYKADGLISPHAWSIVTMLKKSRKCLDETWDFVLPYVEDYFEKSNGRWEFKRK